MSEQAKRHILPTITERGDRGEYAMDPYSRMFKDRIVFVGTALDDLAANDVTVQLLHLDHDNPGRDLAVYLNSPGGSVTAALAVYDTMQSLYSDVETTCLGQVGPEAALLLAAGAPGKRRILPSARIVLREPTMDLDQGSTSDLIGRADELMRRRATLEELFVRHTGQSVARVHEDLSREKILTADEAVAYGLADLVLRRPVAAEERST